jgi:MFS family permease
MSKPASRALQVAAVAAGNALEFYDFIIYSTFAIFIGRAYFPSGGPVVSLLLALATFGIGFVTRPIGGVVLGRIGDRIGRKPAMLIAFALMAVGTLAVTFTPTWRQIGIAAPIIVIIARLIQGFALGGEYGPSTAYLVESAEPGRRGLIGSMQGVGQNLAALTAALVALSLSLALSKADLQAWGWRAAFGLGLLIVPFGLIVRRRIEETAPAREQGPAAGGPFPGAWPWSARRSSPAAP